MYAKLLKALPLASKSIKYEGHICMEVPGAESSQHIQPSHVRLQKGPAENKTSRTETTAV